MKLIFGAIFGILLFSTVTFADAEEHTGTITRKVGKVHILKNPNSDPNKVDAPRVKYGDLYFTESKADKGDQIKLGEVIQTSKVGRARVIFPNGDQFTVSTQTTLQLALDESGKVTAPKIELSRGKFRAVIDSEGPRSGSSVRTRSMVMGVRGTDFFVTNRSGNGLTQVSVIRGQVGVKPAGVDGDEVPVDAGFSAGVGKIDPSAAKDGDDINALVVQVQKTPPMLLAQIDKYSQMPGLVGGPGAVMIASERTPEQIEKEKRLKELEKKAVDATLKDIQKDDPELYKKLKGNPNALRDADKINESATKKAKGKKQKKKAVKKYYKSKK